MTGRIVDIHLHPFSVIANGDLLTEMDRADVDVAVLLALDVDSNDLERPNIKEMVHKRLLCLHAERETYQHLYYLNIHLNQF